MDKIGSSAYYNFQPNTQHAAAQNEIYVFSVNEPESFFEKLNSEQQISII